MENARIRFLFPSCEISKNEFAPGFLIYFSELEKSNKELTMVLFLYFTCSDIYLGNFVTKRLHFKQCQSGGKQMLKF